MAELEQSKILELIRSGKDKEVMPYLYKKVLPSVKSFISKNKGDKEDAYDAFHDALMLFYEQVIRGTFDPKYKVIGYLYRISIYRWINKLQKDKGLVFAEDLPENTVEEKWFDYDWQGKEVEKEDNLLKAFFSKMGDKCVELLTYTIYTDMLMEDIVARMNFVSVAAARMQQTRCKQKLMEEMEKDPELLKMLKGEV